MNESEKKSRRADRAHDRGVRLETFVELVRERMGFEGPHLHGCAAPLSDAPKLIYRDSFTRPRIAVPAGMRVRADGSASSDPSSGSASAPCDCIMCTCPDGSALATIRSAPTQATAEEIVFVSY